MSGHSQKNIGLLPCRMLQVGILFKLFYNTKFIGNIYAIDQLKSIVKFGNMPNLILVGPPGTGKTSSVMCMARQMLGDCVKAGTLELNASDDRGIDVVRDKIK